MKTNWKELIQPDWTLFLDRDGIINERIVGGYVRQISEFQFIENTFEAMARFSKRFRYVIVITNQQGIGKGLMSENQLTVVHDYMLKKVSEHSGRIDAIYVCPQLASEPDNERKPNPAMAYKAAKDFPAIDLSKSVMVGDSQSDIDFGKNAGMMTVFIGDNNTTADASYNSLYEFSQKI